MPTLKLQVPKGKVGALIGRGGKTIRHLTQEYDVSIVLPPNASPSREVLVTGESEDSLAKVKAEMEAITEMKLGDEPLLLVELDVPRGSYGAVIGRGGSVLRGIQAECNVQLDLPRGDEGHCTVEGTRDAVLAAKAKIAELIQQEVPVVSGLEGVPVAKRELIRLDAQPITESLFFPDINAEDGFHFDRFLLYIESARESLDICVFTITDNRIVRALLSHHANGLKIRVITDNDTSAADGSDIEQLRVAGIPVRMDKTSAHMHHKFAVLDGEALLTGSYNWTKGASSANYENMVIVNRLVSEQLINDFSVEFNRLWALFA